MVEPPPAPDQVRLPGNLPPELEKQTLLLFPMCYCTVQIFALESAALPQAPQPRPALAGRLLAPGTGDGSCSDANLCTLLKGKQPARSWPRALGMLCRDSELSLEWSGEILSQPMELVGSGEVTLLLQRLLGHIHNWEITQ